MRDPAGDDVSSLARAWQVVYGASAATCLAVATAGALLHLSVGPVPLWQLGLAGAVFFGLFEVLAALLRRFED